MLRLMTIAILIATAVFVGCDNVNLSLDDIISPPEVQDANLLLESARLEMDGKIFNATVSQESLQSSNQFVAVIDCDNRDNKFIISYHFPWKREEIFSNETNCGDLVIHYEEHSQTDGYPLMSIKYFRDRAISIESVDHEFSIEYCSIEPVTVGGNIVKKSHEYDNGKIFEFKPGYFHGVLTVISLIKLEDGTIFRVLSQYSYVPLWALD